MECRDTRDLISEYLDGALDDGPRAEVEAHLGGCASCAADAAELRKTWQLLERAPGLEPPPGFKERVWARIAETESMAARVEKPVPGWRWLWVPVGSMAAVLLAVTVWLLAPGNGTLSEDQRAEAELVANLDFLEQQELLAEMELLEDFDLLLNLDAMPGADQGEG